ncbi:MAG: PPC domain-containing protein [Myxococcota bacterium]
MKGIAKMRSLVTAMGLIWLGAVAGCQDEQAVDGAFCHGVSDGTPCDDSNPCTVDDRCGSGGCSGRPMPDGVQCDDGDSCTVDDQCQAGVCTGLDLCLEPEPDTTGSDTVQTCATLPEGTPCDDDDPCTVDDACADGACAGTPKTCDAPDDPCSAPACDPNSGECVVETLPDGAACDDGDPCTTSETCTGGTCGGATLAPNGTACDDGDPTTAADRCFGGVCVGTPRVCDEGCCDAEDGDACDDGDACTEGDACVEGRCEGTPVDMDCSHLDEGCLKGACDPGTGQCASVARADGVPCDDGDPCTVDDACAQGTCSGVSLDCSDLDGPCMVGVCDGDEGTCDAVERPDGTPCHDGDPCTGHDACAGGVCVGDVDLCGACEGLSPGAACDDGDPCTPSAGICAQVSTGLRCDAQASTCSDPTASCKVGACDSATGECVLIPLHDGAACDDGDPCTVNDGCGGGTCSGQPREMCGAEPPSWCETGADNGTVADAVPLALEDGALTLLGFLDSEADVDWYAIGVEAGQRVDLVTRSHCGSAIETVLTAVGPDGQSTVASGEDGGFAVLEGDRAGGEGTYFVGVSTLGEPEGTTYFLDIAVADAPPCTEDSDCGCERLECAQGGAAAGTCVPSVPVEQEPDDGPATAVDLPLDQPVLGRLGSPSDEDWYRLDLQAGTPLAITARTSCDEATDGEAQQVVDTRLRLYEADGTTELAYAGDDGAGGKEAALDGFVVPADGTYLLRVTGDAGALGPYEVEARTAGCSLDEPCACADQKCSDPQDGGVCVPLLTAPEPEGDEPPVSLLLGERLHSAVDEPYDEDTFTLTVGEGSYDVITTSYCGSSLDTLVTVYDGGADEPVVLAEDDDGGDERFAAATGLTVGAAQPLRIVVEARGGAVGEYIVVVKPSTEAP